MATKTPTKGAPPAASATPGTAPGEEVVSDGHQSGHGIATPDADSQVSPSRPTAGKDGGPGASEAGARPPVTIPEITEDGLYDGMSDEVYHGQQTSLSSSGARKLLPPGCPALFDYERRHGRPPKREFDQGHAAHARVLGVGAEVVVVQTTAKDGTKSDATDYRTKSAGEHRDEIRAEGKVPILRHELEHVDGMAAAIREHPIARVLFDPELGGKAEQSMFWTDPRYDVVRRARLDWLPPLRPDGRLIVPDYKTTTSASLRSITRSVADYGYHQQDPWYRDVIRGLGLADEVAFVFAFQEKTPPYLITVVELDDPTLRVGRILNDRALQVYAECAATGVWPGHTDDVELISLPPYVLNTVQEL